MTIQRSKLGPGHLTIGAVGSPREFGIALRSISIEPSEDEGDRLEVLSGDVAYDDGEFTGTLKGELFQDYSTDSLLKWTWDNHGQILPFVFQPSADAEMTVTGTVKISRLTIGGTVKEYNTSDIEWRLPEVPTIAAAQGGSQ